MYLNINSVTKRYPDQRKPAVNGVSLRVPVGTTLALVGESGSGKTTLLRLIAGFEEPDRGSIVFRETAFVDRNVLLQSNKRSVAMIFQDLALFPHLHARANVVFGLKAVPKHRKKAAADELLTRVGLLDFGGKYPHELSGGQQQRVALARALATNADLILMDEPFSNLDSELKWRLLNEMRRILKETKKTVVFVTHDREEALALADDIALLRDGELIQHGRPQEMYQNPKNYAVARFFGKTNKMAGLKRGPTVITGVGNFKVMDADRSVEDRHGLLLIRPKECIVSSVVDAQLPSNSFTAEVKDCRFMGEYWEMELNAGQHGGTVFARCANAHHHDHMVIVTFPPEHIHFAPSSNPLHVRGPSHMRWKHAQ